MSRKRMTGTEGKVIAAIDFILAQTSEPSLGRSMSAAISTELIKTLNGSTLPAAHRNRIIGTIRLLKRRQEVISRLRLNPSGREHSRAFIAEFVADAAELNRMLSRYRVSPQVDLYATTAMVSYKLDRTRGAPKAEKDESLAIMRSLQLAERDELNAVGECHCGKFFLASRIDQQHCCTACRVKFHQSSEEFRARRRRSERERYRLNRDGKVKQ